MIIVQKKSLTPEPAVAKPAPAAPARPEPAAAPRLREEGAWRTMPLDGRYEFSYLDAFGNPSRRQVSAAELKVGPGKLLLGGMDRTTEDYRGFRVDRIRALRDVESGELVERNIVDWLLDQAVRQERARSRAERAGAAARRGSRAAAENRVG